jgi:hypothetical protein
VQRLFIEYLGDSIELPRGETIVGRDITCALRFNDPSISRRHLRFIRRADDAFVEDLNSSNGTLLNGRAVRAPLRVRDGDVISVGGRTITIRAMADDDVEMPHTLILRELELEPDEAPRDAIVNMARAPTSQMKVVPEPPGANQRCPRCAAPVSDTDAKCAACNYRWGSRPMTPTIPPLDRRRHDRVPMELRLIYVSNELEIEAMTLDLSQSGVFVRTQILDPVGTRCQLTILIDGGPALRVAGVVRRVVGNNERGEPVGLGVELTDLGATERAWIDIAAVRITS